MAKRVTAEEFVELDKDGETVEIKDKKPDGEVIDFIISGKKVTDPKILSSLRAAHRLKENQKKIKEKVNSMHKPRANVLERRALQGELEVLMKGTVLDNDKHKILKKAILQHARDEDHGIKLIHDAIKLIEKQKKSDREIAAEIGIPPADVDLEAGRQQAREIAVPGRIETPFPHLPYAGPSKVPLDQVRVILDQWFHTGSTSPGVVIPTLDPNTAIFGKIIIDIPTLYNEARFLYYSSDLLVLVPETRGFNMIDTTLTRGLLLLMFTPDPAVTEYTQNDALNYMADCIVWENKPVNNSRKYRTFIQYWPNIMADANSLVQRGIFGYGLDIPAIAPATGSRYQKKEKWAVQNTVHPTGEFGRCHVDPHLLEHGTLHVTRGNEVVMKESAGKGLIHLLTSRHISANAREKLTPKDVQQYQTLLSHGHVKPSKGNTRSEVAKLAILDDGDDAEGLVHRLEVLIAEIGAGNRPNGLIRNECNLILTRLFEMGSLTFDEARKIQNNFSL